MAASYTQGRDFAGPASVLRAALTWRKSGRSGQNGSCVEVAAGPGVVGVRDSKDPHGPYLTVSAEQWSAFLKTVRA